MSREQRRGIDLKKIASGMNGASGAESKAVCTEALGGCGVSTGIRREMLYITHGHKLI